MPDDRRIEIYGDDETIARLDFFELQLRDLRPFWPKVTDLFEEWMNAQFASEGAFFGTPWKPLTAQYAAWKARHFPGKPILYAEGDLKRGATMAERHATPDSLSFTIHWKKGGTGKAFLEGGQYHKHGETELDPGWHHFGMGHNPRRPLLAETLPPGPQAQLDHAAEEYVVESARRAGLLAE